MISPADHSIFQCIGKPCEGCKYFMALKPFDSEGLSCIGSCWLTGMGIFVYAHHLPPCLTWRYEGDSDK